jgi:hypothetical protein
MQDKMYVKKLTDILVKLKAITPEMNDDLEHNFEQSSHEQFDDFLLDQGLVSKEDILKALSILYQVPYMDVDGYFFDSFLLQKFPEDFLLRNAIIPYEQDQNMLIVVAADPSDQELLDKIGAHVSYDIRFNVGIQTDIINMIRMYYDKSLTEPVSYVKEAQIEALDDLPVRQEELDQQEFIDEKIGQFEQDETLQEIEEIDKRAHNAEKKR